MWFITLAILQVLLVSGFVSAEDDEISTEMLQEVLCNEDNAELATIAMDCFDSQNTEDFHPAIQSCNGIEEVNSQSMRDWYCSHTPEEIQSADDCAEEMMADNVEVYMQFLDEYMSCIDNKLEDEKKRK